jgi:hypothetical protein
MERIAGLAPSLTVAFGPSWLFLQRNNSHRSTLVRARALAIGPSWSDMKPEHYGNFIVADTAISRSKAAKENLACSLQSANRYPLISGNGILYRLDATSRQKP